MHSFCEIDSLDPFSIHVWKFKLQIIEEICDTCTFVSVQSNLKLFNISDIPTFLNMKLIIYYDQGGS